MDKFDILANEFGLELVLNQNDLEEADVLRFLYEAGKIDIDDYFYEDVEDVEE